MAVGVEAFKAFYFAFTYRTKPAKDVDDFSLEKRHAFAQKIAQNLPAKANILP